ncbi:glycosyltransferase family 2 protein [Mangrovibacterium diazotrophicum]|uniref:GT2 family glycosyltransferase n=1 Tax=Mangrovibacterium diazotrophicum TaxID=1261403 RepID=A0A419VUU1_9BACT|nr:glycosyltransferase [Mangrovibacterium diazotrophicum]RKD85949.1 GT2 family glycosyltransferase [Mangrovibacterium diazotrophicum]
MKLSVIIVNYNVKHFLEQCLRSVTDALTGIDSEILVVDNNSVDGSCLMVNDSFPKVKLIENKENTGFSRANNQAISVARGEYILLLNPDTLVETDCFRKCVAFMDEHPEAGGLGVKMIDGKGHYLPESKRGIPTPWVSFCKIFGLTALFPHSPRFAGYYLGHLSNTETHEVEVLAGAFMLLRSAALQKAGLLDEQFFMYGEDIDLSVRIRQSGYKNYYFPETKIIHYKGESTKKGSLNYVKLFYKAMLLFSKKHFSGRQNQLFNFTINLAIYFRALLSVVSRVVAAILLPLIDALIILLGFYLLIPVWETFQFEADHFPPEFFKLVVPGYTLIWIVTLLFFHAYLRPLSIGKLLRGILAGGVLVMLFYSFLNENWRFSRALIVLGTCWNLLMLPLIRYSLSSTKLGIFRIKGYRASKIVVIAGTEEAERILSLLENSDFRYELTGLIAPDNKVPGSIYLGNFSQTIEIIDIHRPDELIFSGKDVPPAEIIDCMLDLNDKNIHFKIAPQESLSIIGSSSPNAAGEFINLKSNPLSKKTNLTLKRLLDIKLAIILIIFFPVLFFSFSDVKGLIRNCLAVISGKKTWIGFASPISSDIHLPKLKQGVLTPSSPFEFRYSAAKILDNDRVYAKNYRILTDLELIFRNWKILGQ